MGVAEIVNVGFVYLVYGKDENKSEELRVGVEGRRVDRW